LISIVPVTPSSVKSIDVTPTDLCAAVEEAVVALGPIAGARDARLTRRSASGLPRVRVNRDKLIEIVTNLVENAVKFAPPGTAIDVEVAADGPGRQLISVRDRGPPSSTPRAPA
jgi:signal transduction histidine kinase